MQEQQGGVTSTSLEQEMPMSPSGSYGQVSGAAKIDFSKGQDHVLLEGAYGKEVMFRPQRYSVDEIGDLQMEARFKDFHGQVCVGEVLNFSYNGLAFRLPSNIVLRNGEKLSEFEVWGRGEQVFFGKASVTNQREEQGTLVVGCSLQSGFLDTAAVLGLKEKARIESELQQFRTELSAVFGAGLSDRLRALIGDLRLFLERYRAELNRIEESYSGRFDAREAWEKSILALAEPSFAQQFHGAIRALYEESESLELSEEQQLACRNYAQFHLHHLIEEAPVLSRSYHKPLGYAGDYEVLLTIYNPKNHYQGRSLFGKLMHRMGCSTTASRAGIERIPYLSDKICELVEDFKEDRPYRMFSLACGPAKELQDLVAKRELPHPVEITLFDQDETALSFCHTNFSAILSERERAVKVNYLHSSVSQIIRDRDFVESLPKQDLITSTGLFDYLPRGAARLLVRNLVSMLKPGGHAIIGNFEKNDTKFMFQYLLDWDLVYRSREELMSLVDGLSIPVTVHIENERTGTNLFLVIRRHDDITG